MALTKADKEWVEAQLAPIHERLDKTAKAVLPQKPLLDDAFEDVKGVLRRARKKLEKDARKIEA